MTGSLVRLVAQSLIGVLLTQLAIVAYCLPRTVAGRLGHWPCLLRSKWPVTDEQGGDMVGMNDTASANLCAECIANSASKSLMRPH